MTTFKEQMAADLDVFFNPEEFGKAATYTPVGGTGVSTTILLEEGAGSQDNVFGVNPAAISKATVKLSDIANPKQHDTIAVGTRTWTVVNEISRDDITAVLLVANKERLEC